MCADLVEQAGRVGLESWFKLNKVEQEEIKRDEDRQRDRERKKKRVLESK